MKPLLVGESNPYSIDQRHALLPWPAGAAGDRLRMILGLTDRQYLRAFDRANLVLGQRWSMPAAAREGAAYLMRQRPTRAPMILLGRRVAAAFGVADYPQFTICGRFYLLPHPSGRCRDWSRRGAIAKARAFLSPLLRAEPVAVDGDDEEDDGPFPESPSR